VAGGLLGLGLGAALARFQPAVYQSTAQISISRKHPDPGGDRRLAEDAEIAPPAEVLKSSPIIEAALRGREAAPERVAQVRAGLAVVSVKTPAGQGNLFNLSYRGREGEDCCALLEAVLTSYRESLEKKHQATAGDTVEWLLREQEKVRGELAEQEAAYRAFREQAPLLGKAHDGLELRQERLRNIQSKRSALLLQRVEVEGRLAAVAQARKEGRSPDAILLLLAEAAHKDAAGEAGPQKPPSLQEHLLPLLLEERRLLRLYGAKHPDVVAVREQIETARRAYLLPPNAWKVENPAAAAAGGISPEEAIQAHVEVLRQKLAQLQVSENLLVEAFDREQDEARRLAVYEIRNEAFQSGISLKRQLNESLVKRLNEASLSRDTTGYQVEVIEAPSASRRVAPILPLYLSVGAFLGLVAGLLLASRAGRRTERRLHPAVGLLAEERPALESNHTPHPHPCAP
jgi:uncharacterized protein involved in exopolysaccharide biosynthesis